MFNEYEVVQMVKLRQEEMVRKALDSWKYEEVKQESFFQKWNNRQESITLSQQNDCCPSHCYGFAL